MRIRNPRNVGFGPKSLEIRTKPTTDLSNRKFREFSYHRRLCHVGGGSSYQFGRCLQESVHMFRTGSAQYQQFSVPSTMRKSCHRYIRQLRQKLELQLQSRRVPNRSLRCLEFLFLIGIANSHKAILVESGLYTRKPSI